MAALSDQLLILTIAAYTLTMLCHAAEYAFVPRPALRASHAGSGTGAGTGTRAGAEADRPGRSRVLGQVSGITLYLAAGTHLAAVVARGLAAERLPWGNMYEYLLSTTLVGTVAWLWVRWRYPSLQHLGLYLALLNMVLLAVARSDAVYTPVGPLVAALDSYWFIIHISAASLASGIFLVGFVGAVMYLIRSGYDAGKRRFPYPIGNRLPVAEAIERITFRLHAFGFPIWTLGALIAGPIWAEAAWGRYWGWDPKEVWAFITWVVYAAYLHARATSSVRRSVVAWLAILGWLTMLMNLFGVNLMFDGLHSYA